MNPDDLEGLAEDLALRYRSCDLCPRACGADRKSGELGFCRTGSEPVVSSVGPHFGEEPPLVGRRGSGTIFFGGCNLGCVFCQNDDISHGPAGHSRGARELAGDMLHLQDIGCHNVNFVTPTHVVPSIVEAAAIAFRRGFDLPLIYNCGGYESVDIIRRLEGVIDIYMPDVKFSEASVSGRLCGAADYFERAQEALKEMHRQVGDLCEDERGVAVRGLLVRHLVMPGNIAGTETVMRFLKRDISPRTAVNVMFQYRPCYRAREFPELSRRPQPEECRSALQAARSHGLRILQ